MFMELPDTIILAGGLGTRLRDAVRDIPKSMAPINGKPFLDYQLQFIKAAGFKRVIISTGYLGEQIREYFGNSYRELEIQYSHETEPLGTGGAIKKAFSLVQTPHALVLNGDTMFRIDPDLFFQRHIEKLADVSIALRMVDNASRYGQVKCNSDNQIIAFSEKSAKAEPGIINGGIYLISSRYFRACLLPDKFSFEKDFLEQQINASAIYGQVFNDYFLDIGIPEDYQRAQNEIGTSENR